ncbi:MAG TPA: alpha/beta fold hydrolase [Solirubrobacteraceae bacterium]|nr:alpha/beta fold hydrolase [Solirubrobacteraceae bacterium]
MPDARVQAAIDNWGSRLIANGVDYNDFRRVTSSLERWEDWLDAWTETADGHREEAERAHSAGNALSAGEAFARAAVAYHFAKFVWVVDAERNRATTAKAIAALTAAHGLLDPTAERIEVPFEGARLAANLRRPDGGGRPPLVVLIPGLDSTKEEFFRWEDVFLRRGMATLSMDGPGQGESGFELHIRHDYEVAVAAVLDALAGRDDVDHDHIGAVGVSMGGYYAPRAAAFEPRIRAVAGISGPYDMSANWDNLPSLTRETLQHHTGAASPEEARARAAELNLSEVAERIEQPALVVTGRLDRLIPWEDTKRIADAIPGAEWVLYEHGTHVCNNVPFRYRPLVADWMGDQLAPA